jgi:hypothetical protein
LLDIRSRRPITLHHRIVSHADRCFQGSIVIVQVFKSSAWEADGAGRPVRHRFVYFAPFLRQVSRESRDEFGTGFAACDFEDGFVIHVVGGTLAAGLK